MADLKKKNSWLSWIIVSGVMLILIYFFLFSFLKKGSEQADDVVEARMTNYASVWAEHFKEEMEDARKFGGIIRETIENDNLDIFGEEVSSMAKLVVKNSSFSNVYICNAGGRIVDQKGQSHDYSFYEPYLSGGENKSMKYFFIPKDDLGNENVFVASYPINKGFILFLLDSSMLDDHFIKSSYEDQSFCAVIQKDGTVLESFEKYSDNQSKFVTSGNFLTTVQSGAKAEEYNYFKSKIYSGISYTIDSEIEGDSRTIICVPLTLESVDWYMVFGIRQHAVDELGAAEFSELKGIAIKLLVVLSVLVVFIAATSIVNITRTKERGKKLEDKVDMDLLTELTNKAATERKIAEYMQDNPNGRGVLFILDIDNFKKVNDTMGHAFGDTLLKTLGKEIRTEFRVTDIVGRTGGDEFMIFLKDIKDDLIVEREANRVNHFFHDFKAGGDYVKYSATASIGAAVFPEDGTNFKDLYVSADQALYRAKKRGKNQLVFFNEEKYGK